jgi:hypothetical protein
MAPTLADDVLATSGVPFLSLAESLSRFPS